jgi:hypothetical protein
MKIKLLLSSVLLFQFVTIYSQYKQKFFKDGYIIKQDDTLKCKIYSKNIDELQKKIIYKYEDSDEPIIYYPGSIIKGFGLTIDGKSSHYITLPKPLDKKGKNTELIFAEVVTNGFLKLFKYSFTKEQLDWAGANLNSTSIAIPIKRKSKKRKFDYFIYRSDIDSSSSLSTYMKDNMVKLNKELIDRFFGDNPDLLKKIEYDISIAIFSQYLDEYNLWYKKNNKE